MPDVTASSEQGDGPVAPRGHRQPRSGHRHDHGAPVSDLWSLATTSPVSGVLTLLGAILVALGLDELAFHALRRTRRPWVRSLSTAIARHCWWPSRAVIVTLLMDTLLPNLHLPPAVQAPLLQLTGLALIAAVAWMVAAVSFGLEDAALARLRVDVRDNLKARRVQPAGDGCHARHGGAAGADERAGRAVGLGPALRGARGAGHVPAAAAPGEPAAHPGAAGGVRRRAAPGLGQGAGGRFPEGPSGMSRRRVVVTPDRTPAPSAGRAGEGPAARRTLLDPPCRPTRPMASGSDASWR